MEAPSEGDPQLSSNQGFAFIISSHENLPTMVTVMRLLTQILMSEI